jgi:hypothetical protein
MRTVDIDEAAEILGMHPESLRRKMRQPGCTIPGSKPGKHWRFVAEHLYSYISNPKQSPKQEALENSTCVFTKEKTVVLGGYRTNRQTAQQYADLLGQKTNKKPRNMPTG